MGGDDRRRLGSLRLEPSLARREEGPEEIAPDFRLVGVRLPLEVLPRPLLETLREATGRDPEEGRDLRSGVLDEEPGADPVRVDPVRRRGVALDAGGLLVDDLRRRVDRPEPLEPVSSLRDPGAGRGFPRIRGVQRGAEAPERDRHRATL